jgi:hypothetical protein
MYQSQENTDHSAQELPEVARPTLCLPRACNNRPNVKLWSNQFISGQSCTLLGLGEGPTVAEHPRALHQNIAILSCAFVHSDILLLLTHHRQDPLRRSRVHMQPFIPPLNINHSMIIRHGAYSVTISRRRCCRDGWVMLLVGVVVMGGSPNLPAPKRPGRSTPLRAPLVRP